MKNLFKKYLQRDNKRKIKSEHHRNKWQFYRIYLNVSQEKLPSMRAPHKRRAVQFCFAQNISRKMKKIQARTKESNNFPFFTFHAANEQIQ